MGQSFLAKVKNVRLKAKKSKSKKQTQKLKLLSSYFFLGSKLFIAFNVVFSAYNIIFIGRILPNVSVVGFDVSGLTPTEARDFLSKSITQPKELVLKTDSDEFNIDLTNIDLRYDIEKTTHSAYKLFRTGNFVYDAEARIEALWKKRDLGILIAYDAQKFDEIVSVVAGQIAIEPIYPQAVYENGEVVILDGQTGLDVNVNKLRADLGNALSMADTNPVVVETQTIDTSLSEKEKDDYKKRAENLLEKKLQLNFEYDTFTYKAQDLFKLISPKGGYNDDQINSLVTSIATSIDRSPQNPHFEFQSAEAGGQGKVVEFAPAKPGVVVDATATALIIKEGLKKLESGEEKVISTQIAAKLSDPEISTDKVNDLGIRELIGRGSSTFRGSISSRIYNINLAATRLNGILIKPGDTFSFNNALGDVSQLTGYKEAYVIKDGKTVLGDGGGVCQVSTTLFRAALAAGLPITERRAHAYRVGYYEQDAGPGLDATVYSPTTNLKFKNNTPAHILIQAYPNTKNLSLVFELYGTSDGRAATTTKPIISNVTPPPEDLYVDDPTLPVGTIKQIDWKAWGAKSVFYYTVTRSGQTIYEKTFVSNYRPWQSVYLRGTGPVQ